MESKRALITGGSGYLGSHLSKALKEAGWHVVIFDLVPPAHRYYDYWCHGNICDNNDLFTLFDSYQFDTVFHLAGRIEVGESMKHPTEFWYNNVAGTANLLRRMQSSNTNKIIFSSTAAVYEPKLLGSWNKYMIHENHPLTNNNSVYGNTKLACEQMIKDSGMKYGIFRYFNLAGADPDGEMGENHKPETHLIPNILENLNNVIVYGDDYNTKDGTCVRDYVHVSDVADAHVTASSYIDNESFILNLGNGTGYSVLEIIEYIKKCGVNVKYTFGKRRSGDPDILIADSSLAKQKQIFNPKHDIESIINTAFYWHICKREEEVI